MAEEQQTELDAIFNADDAGDQAAGDQTAGDQTAAPSLLSRMREAGFEDLPDDEAVAHDRLFEAFTTQVASVGELNARIQKMEEMQAATARMINQSPPPERETGTDQQSPWPTIPNVDLVNWQRYRTEQGWSDDTPEGMAQSYADFTRATEEWTRRLLYQPQDALRDPIRHEVAEMLRETFGCELNDLPGRMDIDGHGAAADRMYGDAEPYLYQVNPLNNQPDQSRLTEFGQMFSNAMSECIDFAKRYGQEASTQDQVEYAYKQCQHALNTLKDQNGRSTSETNRGQRHSEHRGKTRGGTASGGANRAAGAGSGGSSGSESKADLSRIGMQFADAFTADGGLG